MRRSSFVGGALGVLLASVAGAANVTINDGGYGSSHDPDGTGFGQGSLRGGLFSVTVNNVTGIPSGSLGGDIVAGAVFLTFCVEIGETIGFGGSYNFAVNDESINGGASLDNPQPLANQTAYLYSSFRAGTLVTSFSATSNADVNALQDAIWFFQNQLGEPDVHDNGSVTLSTKAQAFVDEANLAGWTNIGNVRVLNIGPGSGPNMFNNQDVLALIPLPQGVGLASMGLLVIGARRRRSL